MFSWRLQIETTIAIQPKIWEKMSICDCLDLTKWNFQKMIGVSFKSYSSAFHGAALL